MYEVELKFPLADAGPVVQRLAALGARTSPVLEQADLYFNHPARDFAESDEALRIRSVGDQNLMTYKGPVVDSQTKTRREIEVPVGDRQARDKFAEVLTLLGFRQVREVRKTRQPYHVAWHGREFEIALDQVAELGSFIEVETLASESDRPAAVEAILALAGDLGLSGHERKSYLCLLLEKTGKNS
jgi:adenylate cyclase class 2